MIAPKAETNMTSPISNTPILAKKPPSMTIACPGTSKPNKGDDSSSAENKIIQYPQWFNVGNGKFIILSAIGITINNLSLYLNLVDKENQKQYKLKKI